MSKRPPFDPGVLNENKPSQSLKPFDYMKPMEEAQNEGAATDAVSTEARADHQNTRGLESKRARVTIPATPVERPIFLTPVNTREAPINRGFHMYPSRHRQLLDLAYIEDRKPWEVIEQALAEYVKRHYSGKTKI